MTWAWAYEVQSIIPTNYLGEKMNQYVNLIKDILENGNKQTYRNGQRVSVFGKHMQFNMSDGFPIVTIKKTHYKAAMAEMFWIMSGSDNTRDLMSHYPEGKDIWKEWSLGEDITVDNSVYSEGSIGPLYGKAWRMAPNYSPRPARALYEDPECPLEDMVAPDILKQCTEYTGDIDSLKRFLINRRNSNYIDQLWEVVNSIKNNPYSTRHRITANIPAWTPDESLSPHQNILRGKGALTPCHNTLNFMVSDVEGVPTLSLHMLQSSGDVLLGVPFNIVGYSSLLMMMAHHLDMAAGTFHHHIVNAHIYSNQIPHLLASDLINREPMPLPTLEISDDFDFWNPTLGMLEIKDYQHHPFEPFPVST